MQSTGSGGTPSVHHGGTAFTSRLLLLVCVSDGFATTVALNVYVPAGPTLVHVPFTCVFPAAKATGAGVAMTVLPCKTSKEISTPTSPHSGVPSTIMSIEFPSLVVVVSQSADVKSQEAGEDTAVQTILLLFV